MSEVSFELRGALKKLEKLTREKLITAEDFDLPEKETEEWLYFGPDIFRDLKSIKEQIMRAYMVPQQFLISKEEWDSLMEARLPEEDIINAEFEDEFDDMLRPRRYG